MNMVILTSHIVIASIMTLATVGVFAAAYSRRETKAYLVMLTSFAATVVSGIALLFVSAGGLGRFCAMMSMFTLMTIAAGQYYRVRVLANSSL